MAGRASHLAAADRSLWDRSIGLDRWDLGGSGEVGGGAFGDHWNGVRLDGNLIIRRPEGVAGVLSLDESRHGGSQRREKEGGFAVHLCGAVTGVWFERWNGGRRESF